MDAIARRAGDSRVARSRGAEIRRRAAIAWAAAACARRAERRARAGAFCGSVRNTAAPRARYRRFCRSGGLIESSVPKPEQNRAAQLLLRVLEGAVWELWQVSRARAGEPALKETEANRRFVQSAMNALS